MSLWVWITILAAISQSLRSAQQKRLKSKLGDYGASFVRFSYAIPFAWTALLGYCFMFDYDVPQLNLRFLGWVTLGGVLQIIFTVLLIKLFSLRSFAAATAFSKTEVLQVVFFEAIIIGVIASFQVTFGILIGILAIMFLSVARSKINLLNFLNSLFTRQAGLGLASGSFLALCSVCFRAATDSLDGNDLVTKAGTTLAISVIIQTSLMGLWLKRYAPNELKLSIKNWQPSLVVGFFGALTSFCWFYAFSANAVAPVRAVGQIELLITVGLSIFYFREKTTWKELVAIVLLLVSIIMVLLD